MSDTEMILPGLQGKSASDVFSQARSAAAASGHTPQLKPIQTGVYCPTCRGGNIPDTPVIADTGGIHCTRGHKFVDQDDLMGMQPDKMKLKQRETKQERYVPVTFQIPEDVHIALVKKFGEERVGAALSGMMMALTEDNALLVCDADLTQMTQQCFGARPKSSQELKGLVLNLYAEKKNALDAASQGGSQSGESSSVRLRPREYVVGLTRDSDNKLTTLANDRHQPRETVLETALESALENNWI